MLHTTACIHEYMLLIHLCACSECPNACVSNYYLHFCEEKLIENMFITLLVVIAVLVPQQANAAGCFHGAHDFVHAPLLIAQRATIFSVPLILKTIPCIVSN